MFGRSGHGLLEINAFDQFLNGKVADDELSADVLAASLASVPEI